ncbi:MAG: aspartate 1-decarboxylase [Alphaproteobacteria bacterium]|nr:aspartate 1-decarboxylase [Alphaproteobacteria bacterium]
MLLTMMKGKIHRAVCTGADLHYNGSITVDPLLLKAAGILEHEQVDVLNISNGARLTTYAIKSKKAGGGEITINGAAAHLVKKGDLLIICAFAQMKPKAAAKHKPKVILVDARNQIAKTARKSVGGKHVQPKLVKKR